MAAFVVPFALNSSFTSAASAQSLSARRHLRYTGARSRRSAANYRLNRHDLIIKASVRSSEAPIELMCCDMDGTLLTDDKSVTPKNIEAVSRLLDETDVLFMPATGKSRSGALKSMNVLGDKLNSIYPDGVPGVYLQGLIVYDLNGSIVHENMVSKDLAYASVAISRDLNLDLIAYNRDSILCERLSKFTDLLPTYHEPDPINVGKWETVIGKKSLNKMIFMAEPSRVDAIRPIVQERIGRMCHLTQAQDNMLEVLPPDASKGDGVRRLLEHLNIKPQNVLAIGDAENDVQLLEMVGYSCVVANALPSAKAAAKYSGFSSNEEQGVADAILRFLLPASVGSK